MTGLLGVIVMYIFAAVTYFSDLRNTLLFVEDQDLEMCTTFLHCYLTMLSFGMRSGGGIGDTILYPDF